MVTARLEVSTHMLNLWPFRIMCRCILKQGKIAKYTQSWKRVWWQCRNNSIREIYEVSVSIHFVFEGQVIHPSNVVVGNAVVTRNDSKGEFRNSESWELLLKFFLRQNFLQVSASTAICRSLFGKIWYLWVNVAASPELFRLLRLDIFTLVRF